MTAPLLRNRGYRLLWGSQALSEFGVNASRIAFALLVLSLTGTAAASGLVQGTSAAAALLIGLPAGVLSPICARFPGTQLPCRLRDGRRQQQHQSVGQAPVDVNDAHWQREPTDGRPELAVTRCQWAGSRWQGGQHAAPGHCTLTKQFIDE